MPIHDLVNAARKAIPTAALPRVIQFRAAQALRDEAVRQRFTDEMTLLVGNTERASEIEALVEGRAHWKSRRAELRWHPELITHQRVDNPEVLTRRDRTRGCVVSFMHHGQYDGLLPSIARHIGPLKIVIAPFLIAAGAPSWAPQHVRVVTVGGSTAITTEGGVAGLMAKISPGGVLAIAADMPGSTPHVFLNREYGMPSGAARIASGTDSLVVVATSRPGPGGEPTIHLHDALDPRDFADPLDLLVAMLRPHEQSVLQWPEAYDEATARFSPLDAVGGGAGPRS